MLRCPLESIALRIKTLKLGFISEFLSKAIEPPTKESIDHVVAVLRGLTALDTTSVLDNGSGSGSGKKGTRVEQLTPLGTLLAQLPVDPRIGKMMLYGAIFRCIEPTLIIAASLAFRSVNNKKDHFN